jgi:dihydrofolate reductase/thymidylate synthase
MFTLIAAVDINAGLARDDLIPWDCPADRKHFKETTMGHVVIMGRKTWESIPKAIRPLAGRVNVVLSRGAYDTGSHEVRCMTFDDCVAQYSNAGAFVIGGAEIYEKFLTAGLISRMLVSHVIKDHDCDLFFPVVKATNWNLTSNVDLPELNEVVELREYTAVNHEEIAFLGIIKQAMTGAERVDRTGVGTRSIFARQLRFSLGNGRLPLMTHRKMALRMIAEELFWLLNGCTDAKELAKKRVPVWNANSSREFLDRRGLAYAEGDIGPSYGFQLRHWGAEYRGCGDYTGQGFDQLQYVMYLLTRTPTSRRIMFSLWNPADLNAMALPPCAWSAQFYVNAGKLSCILTQRSSDIALAGGWNIAQYALLTHMLAKVCDLEAEELIWNAGDIHVYNNQLKSAEEIVDRTPRPFPVIRLAAPADGQITSFQWKDITLIDYHPLESISIPMNP